MKGIISQVMGPVVDIDFTDYLPKINEAVEVNFEVEGKQNSEYGDDASNYENDENDSDDDTFILKKYKTY